MFDRDLALHHLERSDRPTELLALLGVGERVLHDVSRAARRRRREPEPAGIQHLERDAEALPHVAQPVLDRNFHFVEEHGARVGGLDAHLLFALAERHAGARARRR